MNCDMRIADWGLVPCVDEAGAVLKEVVLAPDGEVKSLRGDFVVDAEGVELARLAFEAHSTDVPIDYEHQTLGGTYASPSGRAEAAGWIKAIRHEAERGVMAAVEWTTEALELIRSKKYRYLSPVAVIRKSDRKLVGIHSAGLTNKPAIPGMEALAAKQGNPGTEKKIMAEEPTEAPSQDALLIKLGQVIEKYGLDVEAGAGAEAVIDALLAKSAGGGEAKGGEEGGESEVASSARTALGLSKAADAKTVVVAIDTLKKGGESNVALTTKVNALTKDLAERNANDVLRPYIEKGVVNPENKEDYKIFANMARERPDDCKHILDGRVDQLPMSGQTIEPVPGKPGGARANEEELIANAMKEHKQYGKAVAALQMELMEPFKAQGLTNKAAIQECRARYPKIFADAA